MEVPHRETRLREAITPVDDRYDYILIDCPPSLGLLTVNGLVAARDGVIIPVQCEYLALEGLGQLTQTINRVRASLFPELKVRGVILTMYRRAHPPGHGCGQPRCASISPTRSFKAVIPRSIRLAEAPSYGMPISIYAPESIAAKAYDALAREVLATRRRSHPQFQTKGAIVWHTKVVWAKD